MKIALAIFYLIGGRCGGLAHRRGGWGVTKYAPGGRLPPFIMI